MFRPCSLHTKWAGYGEHIIRRVAKGLATHGDRGVSEKNLCPRAVYSRIAHTPYR